jgi:2'-hydroxyisoflavone reductase
MDKILILGGSNFIGRNLVDSLTQLDKFDITLFNRGKTNADLRSEIKKIIGDRNTIDVNQIFNEKWDYIIDLSCYFPDSLEKILQKIDKSLKRYLFVSTCSVYDNDLNKSILRNEDSPTLDCNNSERVDNTLATYGKRKAECERILMQSGLVYSIFRPSLVYGQYDSTDRFYYWTYLLKNEKALLIPNQGKNIFSVTYVMDLVQVIIKSLNLELDSNIYNVTTYPKLSISELVDTASQILGKQAKTYFVDSEFLSKHNVAQWTDLPLWLDCDYFTYNNKKILSELKMEITDFRNSVLATIDYYETLGWKEPNYGMKEKVKNGLIEELMNNNNS